MKFRNLKESFEMAVGGDDFDGEIAAMRQEQADLERHRAARKERFALMHKLFDAHIDAEPDASWVDKVYHIFDTAESTTFVGSKYGTIPGRTEDKQPIRYRFSIKEYDFYTDPYWEVVYIGTNNVDPLKEDLEDEFDLYMKASELKCKLSRYDIEEANEPSELVMYMEDVYHALVDAYGADKIKCWSFYEDDDMDGVKVTFQDGTKKIVEIVHGRVYESDNISESYRSSPSISTNEYHTVGCKSNLKESATTQYVICGVTNEGTRMLYDAVNDNFTTDYDSATKYDDMDVARDDWFKIPRSGFRRIFIPIYDPAVFETLTETISVGNLVTHVDDGDKTRGTVVSINNNIATVCVGDPSNKDYVDVSVDKLELDESFDVDRVLKRIAHVDEFDNGNVFFNDYELMTSAEAEDKARRLSLEDPSKIFYVKYDDIMNPSSDIKWKNGEKIVAESVANELDYTDSDTEEEVEYGYYVYDSDDNIVSDLFYFEEDAIEYAQEYDYPVVKRHEYLYNDLDELASSNQPVEIWRN